MTFEGYEKRAPAEDFSRREPSIKPNSAQIVVWGINIFISFSLRAINRLLQTLNSLTNLKQRNKVECNDQEIPFVFFSLSSFCWKCEEVYEVIHLYPNRNIGFAILDQPIGLSMLYSHCLWHQMIHEALEESKLPPHPLPHTHTHISSESIVQCNIWGESLRCPGWDYMNGICIWRCLNRAEAASVKEIMSNGFLLTYNYENYYLSHNNKLKYWNQTVPFQKDEDSTLR